MALGGHVVCLGQQFSTGTNFVPWGHLGMPRHLIITTETASSPEKYVCVHPYILMHAIRTHTPYTCIYTYIKSYVLYMFVINFTDTKDV